MEDGGEHCDTKLSARYSALELSSEDKVPSEGRDVGTAYKVDVSRCTFYDFICYIYRSIIFFYIFLLRKYLLLTLLFNLSNNQNLLVT